MPEHACQYLSATSRQHGYRGYLQIEDSAGFATCMRLYGCTRSASSVAHSRPVIGFPLSISLFGLGGVDVDVGQSPFAARVGIATGPNIPVLHVKHSISGLGSPHHRCPQIAPRARLLDLRLPHGTTLAMQDSTMTPGYLHAPTWASSCSGLGSCLARRQKERSRRGVCDGWSEWCTAMVGS
jgi:hypothetical protein